MTPREISARIAHRSRPDQIRVGALASSLTLTTGIVVRQNVSVNDQPTRDHSPQQIQIAPQTSGHGDFAPATRTTNSLHPKCDGSLACRCLIKSPQFGPN